MRAVLTIAALALTPQLRAQPVVTSPAPERVAVTVYRDPERGLRPLNLQWLRGYALVSETRRISLPMGESEVRFEGVTSGIVPQSAIVTGLGEAVLEKNRDARLLSPGALLDAHLGQRLLLRRTSRATGQVRVQDAIVRASENGVILQTEEGFEALRCTGLNETVLTASVPQGLSAKPTLSVRIRSPRAAERDVTLSYITNNFDWQTDYIGELSGDGRKLSLFGWMTIANGDDTALRDAAAQAVAGKLNREHVWVEPGQARPISLNCWPSETTTDGVAEEMEEIVVTGSRAVAAIAASAPPPPPPAPATLVSADVIAQQESLGDVRLYRIPISVTVAARSQKQVAMIRRPVVQVDSLLRLRPPQSEFSGVLPRLLVTRNQASKGLGVPLPAGKLALFATRQGRRILIGEGRIDDHTVGEKVEVEVAASTGVWALQTVVPQGVTGAYLLKLTNDLDAAQTVEIELPLRTKVFKGGKLIKGDGWMVWRVQVPANGSRELLYWG